MGCILNNDRLGAGVVDLFCTGGIHGGKRSVESANVRFRLFFWSNPAALPQRWKRPPPKIKIGLLVGNWGLPGQQLFRGRVPQRLKPKLIGGLTARLKSCPSRS